MSRPFFLMDAQGRHAVAINIRPCRPPACLPFRIR